MIRVFFESKSYTEEVAIFHSDENYNDCSDVLEALAKGEDAILTETSLTYSLEEYQRELALVSSIVIHEEILKGSVIDTFDKAYEIAVAYVEEHGTDWIYNVDVDYEEHVIEFAHKFLNP